MVPVSAHHEIGQILMQVAPALTVRLQLDAGDSPSGSSNYPIHYQPPN